MLLTLYRTVDGENVINKTITNPVAIDVNFKNDVDVENPEIILTRIDGVNFSDFNYCHIDVFERFYFIREKQHINNSLIKFSCECDYLETYKADILASVGTYQKVLASGDYGQLDLSTTGREIISEYPSSVSLEPEPTNLLTVLRWQQ